MIWRGDFVSREGNWNFIGVFIVLLFSKCNIKNIL